MSRYLIFKTIKLNTDFQAKASESVVQDNIMFNAPRNGITFNDPFGGGDVIRGNLAFSAMRETTDGGTYDTFES